MLWTQWHKEEKLAFTIVICWSPPRNLHFLLRTICKNLHFGGRCVVFLVAGLIDRLILTGPFANRMNELKT